MSAADLLALAERVEAATGPDRELDVFIAERLGWNGSSIERLRAASPLNDTAALVNAANPDGYLRNLPHYTASLDAALTLVPEGWAWMTGCDVDEPFFATLAPTDESNIEADDVETRAATPALALCAASLRARAAQESGK